MLRDFLWLTDAQFARLGPLSSTNTRASGTPLIEGGQRHCARAQIRRPLDRRARCLRPAQALYNHFVRWAATGVWVEIFQALASSGSLPAQVLIDSSAVKAHRCAYGTKGGTRPGDRPLARWPPGRSML